MRICDVDVDEGKSKGRGCRMAMSSVGVRSRRVAVCLAWAEIDRHGGRRGDGGRRAEGRRDPLRCRQNATLKGDASTWQTQCTLSVTGTVRRRSYCLRSVYIVCVCARVLMVTSPKWRKGGHASTDRRVCLPVRPRGSGFVQLHHPSAPVTTIKEAYEYCSLPCASR